MLALVAGGRSYGFGLSVAAAGLSVATAGLLSVT